MKYSLVIVFMLICLSSTSQAQNLGVPMNEAMSLYLVEAYHIIQSPVYGEYEQFGLELGNYNGSNDFGVPTFSESINVSDGSYFSITVLSMGATNETVLVEFGYGSTSAQGGLYVGCCGSYLTTTDWGANSAKLYSIKEQVDDNGYEDMQLIDGENKFGFTYRYIQSIMIEDVLQEFDSYHEFVYNRETGVVETMYLRDSIRISDGTTEDYYEYRLLHVTKEKSEPSQTVSITETDQFKIPGLTLNTVIMGVATILAIQRRNTA